MFKEPEEDRSCNLRDLQEGLVGRVLMRKSGRVQLLLGNVTLDVDLGTTSSFLQVFFENHWCWSVCVCICSLCWRSISSQVEEASFLSHACENSVHVGISVHSVIPIRVRVPINAMYNLSPLSTSKSNLQKNFAPLIILINPAVC